MGPSRRFKGQSLYHRIHRTRGGSELHAQAYLKLNDTQGAIDAYKKAIKLDPGRDDTHTALGNLYFYEKRYQEAQQEYEQAVKLNPSAANRFL